MRVAIFIDGNNFYFGLRKLYGGKFKAMRFNFNNFCNFTAKNREIIQIYYYNAPLDRTKDLEKYKSQQKFFERLRKIPKL